MKSDAGGTARPGEWRRGWRVVAAAMIGIGMGPGLFQNFSSLFIDGLTSSFGWSRGDLATAAGIGLLGALGGPFLGGLADRAGTRVVIIAAMLLLGLAYAGFASMNGGLWQYLLLVFLLSLSVAGTSAVVYGKLIAARFERHRDMALGVATSGIAISSLALSPLLARVVADHSWRAGFALLGGLVVFVALPAILRLLRGGDAAGARHDRRGGAPRRRFWRLGASAALVDRYRPQAMDTGFALLSALAFLGLVAPAAGLALLLVLVFVAGLMNGAEHDLLPFLVARLFGLRAYGACYGLLLAVALAGTATGVMAFGRLHDATGDYAAALALAAGALGVAGALFYTLRDRPLPLAQTAARPA